MQITTYTINENGLNEIKEFLQANHKRGAALGPKEIAAWAAEAEVQLGEGNSPTIEVGAAHSEHGHAVTYTVSSDGLDAQVVEIDDE